MLGLKERKPTSVETVNQTARLDKVGYQILVAEDNSTNREVIKHQLKRLGYTAELANDGQEALEKLQTGRYDLLLTDCHMPRLDGYDLTKAVRQAEQDSESNRRLPIIAITANAIRGEAERCHELGMDAFLTKPVQLENLKTVLEKWLPGVTQNEASSAPSPEQPVNADLSNVHFDKTQLPGLVGDEPQLLIDLLKDYLESSAEIEADMQRSWSERDWISIGKQGHKLKSAARSVGALVLGDICEALQNAGKAQDQTQVGALYPQFLEEYQIAREAVNDHTVELGMQLLDLLDTV